MTLYLDEVKVNKINRSDALSFLGYREKSGEAPDENITALLDKYEGELLKAARPKAAVKVFGIEDRTIERLLLGDDIREHLGESRKAAFMCVTLGAETDKFIRQTEVKDLAGTVVLEALAGALTEQICNLCEKEIGRAFPGFTLTERYSPGYGDYPIEVQGDFLAALDAGRKIGLFASAAHILTPRKSVTAVLGLL